MKKITIPYFPIGIKYTTPFLVGSGLYIWAIGYPLWMGVMVLLAAILLTTEYVTEINLDKNEYRDYLSLLWIPFSEQKVKFEQMQKIVITKVNHSQMLNSRSSSRQLDWSSFTGTLILDNNKTLDLLTRTDKKELMDGLKEFAEFLQVGIEDQTGKI